MAELYERIENLCARKHVSITTMCKESGANRSSLTDLKMGRKLSLSAETLSLIGRYFGVTVEYLLYGDEKTAAQDGDGLDEVMDFLRTLPPVRLRGILLALEAPAEVLAALDREAIRK